MLTGLFVLTCRVQTSKSVSLHYSLNELFASILLAEQGHTKTKTGREERNATKQEVLKDRQFGYWGHRESE